MTEHPQELIRHGDMEAEVDVDIAPLILACWKAGLVTFNSCQNNQGRVWVEFPALDAEVFASVCAGGYDPDVESLHNRVVHEYEPDDWEKFRAHRAWRYDAHAHNLKGGELDEATDELIEPELGTPAIVGISVSVRFPRSDLDEVVARLNAYARDPAARRRLEGGEY